MAGFLYSPSHCCCSQLENQPLKIGFQEAAQLYSCQEIEDPVTNVQYLLIRHHRPLLFSVNSRWRSFLIFFFFFFRCACPSCVPFTLHFHFSTFFMIVFIIFALIIFAFSSPVPPLYFHLHYYLYIFMDCLLSTHTFFLPFTSFCSHGFSRCFKY